MVWWQEKANNQTALDNSAVDLFNVERERNNMVTAARMYVTDMYIHGLITKEELDYALAVLDNNKELIELLNNKG